MEDEVKQVQALNYLHLRVSSWPSCFT